MKAHPLAGKTSSLIMENTERLSMRQWLRDQVDSEKFPGVFWINREEGRFHIPWKHGSKHGWCVGKDAALFREWAIYNGRYKEGLENPTPKKWKANFRCAINALKNIYMEEPTDDQTYSKRSSRIVVMKMEDIEEPESIDEPKKASLLFQGKKLPKLRTIRKKHASTTQSKVVKRKCQEETTETDLMKNRYEEVKKLRLFDESKTPNIDNIMKNAKFDLADVLKDIKDKIPGYSPYPKNKPITSKTDEKTCSLLASPALGISDSLPDIKHFTDALLGKGRTYTELLEGETWSPESFDSSKSDQTSCSSPASVTSSLYDDLDVQQLDQLAELSSEIDQSHPFHGNTTVDMNALPYQEMSQVLLQRNASDPDPFYGAPQDISFSIVSTSTDETNH